MRNDTHPFLDGFGAERLALGLDDPTPGEVLRTLDPHREAEPGLTPWRRSCHAGIRTALAG